jgi:hypothetical protein
MAKLLDSKEVRFENWQGKIFVDGEEQPHMAHWYVGAKEILIRPTIADVVMWLYEKHGIWVYTYFLGLSYSCYVIQKIQKTNPTQPLVQLVKDSITYDELFNSPQEAYSAAFDYILNELI